MKKKVANEITVWVGRDGHGDFILGAKRAFVSDEVADPAVGKLWNKDSASPCCRKHGLALGLHRIVKKGQVARVTFMAKAIK